MPGVSVEKSARAGCVVVALHGELDVCTALEVSRALTALAPTGARIIVDLAELAFMDCYSLSELRAVRAQARLAGGDLVLADPQPAVLRLLVLCDMVSRWLVFTSVDAAVSGAGSATAAIMPGTAGDPAAAAAGSGIVSSALFRGGAAMRHARMLTGIIAAASRKRHEAAGTR